MLFDYHCVYIAMQAPEDGKINVTCTLLPDYGGEVVIYNSYYR
jgi:hypothetical protein